MNVKNVCVGDVNFKVIDEGYGVPVLLVHGFPDSKELWRYQIPALVKAGYRVIAPDMRGYGDSYRPEGVENYKVKYLVQDLVDILDALDIEKVHLVAHDWGAGVSWSFAGKHPDRVRCFMPLAFGNPLGYLTQQTISQREMGWYVLFFQNPRAEELLAANNWQILREWARHHPESAEWVAAMSEPEAFTAALNWYRAAISLPGTMTAEDFPQVPVPVRGVIATGDHCLGEEQMKTSEKFASDFEYLQLDGASHWMQLDKPEVVSDIILNFLKDH